MNWINIGPVCENNGLIDCQSVPALFLMLIRHQKEGLSLPAALYLRPSKNRPNNHPKLIF